MFFSCLYEQTLYKTCMWQWYFYESHRDANDYKRIDLGVLSTITKPWHNGRLKIVL